MHRTTLGALARFTLYRTPCAALPAPRSPSVLPSPGGLQHQRAQTYLLSENRGSTAALSPTRRVRPRCGKGNRHDP